MSRHHETRGRAMGSDVHVIVVGGPTDLAEAAVERLAELERKWTRFEPKSELSRMNANHGFPTVVSPETALLVPGP